MNIILVSGKLSKTWTVTLTAAQLAFAIGGAFIALLIVACAVQYGMLRYASSFNNPLVNTLLVSTQQAQNDKNQSYLQENLNALASKLGQMQAQLLRLDTLGERLAKTAGFKPSEFMFDQPPGRGGAISSVPMRNLTLDDLERQVDLLTQQVDMRSEQLGILDSAMIYDSVKRKLLPSVLPTEGGWFSSGFGWRIDPFNGLRAFHEGMDFTASIGAPIYAAAGGVVVYSDFHPQYGNMIEIDHGNELVTRYAHASKREVKTGDVVRIGVKIGEVGNTGRSTGAHLHFEVRERGAPLNPGRYMRLAG
jgi:murein DD-endopeptidase MepM/ murein hydrolase activator NlpD